MKRFHVLMMTAALLVSATTVNAISPTMASMQALAANAQEAARLDNGTHDLEVQFFFACAQAAAEAPDDPRCPFAPWQAQFGSPSCPALNASASWLAQALQQTLAAWQRVRIVCSGGSEGCGMPTVQMKFEMCVPTNGAKAACCAGAKCCGTTTTAAACCCEKGCSCCETCKAKKEAQASGPAGCTLPSPGCALPAPACVTGGMPPMMILMEPCTPPCVPADAHGHWVPVPSATGWVPAPHPVFGFPFPHPTPPMQVMSMPKVMPVPMQGASFQVGQMAQMPGCTMTFEAKNGENNSCVRIVRIAEPACCAPAQHAHLVTPDLDAHCERMIHTGDVIVLEGNVLLVCKKNRQPIRIEAPRVTLNMKDGTFIVESEAPASRPVAVHPCTQAQPCCGQSCPMLDRVHGDGSDCPLRQLRAPTATPVYGIFQVMPIPKEEMLPPLRLAPSEAPATTPKWGEGINSVVPR